MKKKETPQCEISSVTWKIDSNLVNENTYVLWKILYSYYLVEYFLLKRLLGQKSDVSRNLFNWNYFIEVNKDFWNDSDLFWTNLKTNYPHRMIRNWRECQTIVGIKLLEAPIFEINLIMLIKMCMTWILSAEE